MDVVVGEWVRLVWGLTGFWGHTKTIPQAEVPLLLSEARGGLSLEVGQMWGIRPTERSWLVEIWKGGPIPPSPRKLLVQAALQQGLAMLPDSREFEFTELADAQCSVSRCLFRWQTLGYHPSDTT